MLMKKLNIYREAKTEADIKYWTKRGYEPVNGDKGDAKHEYKQENKQDLGGNGQQSQRGRPPKPNNEQMNNEQTDGE